MSSAPSTGGAWPNAGRESTGKLLAVGLRGWEERLQEGLSARGYEDVRVAHYAVFRHLKPEGSRVTELAREARMTKQSMGELVSYLEKHGYVQRRPDPCDRRARVVVMTEKGQNGYRAAAERVAEIEAAVAGYLGEERLEELTGSLGELVALLAEPLPVPEQ